MQQWHACLCLKHSTALMLVLSISGGVQHMLAQLDV